MNTFRLKSVLFFWIDSKQFSASVIKRLNADLKKIENWLGIMRKNFLKLFPQILNNCSLSCWKWIHWNKNCCCSECDRTELKGYMTPLKTAINGLVIKNLLNLCVLLLLSPCFFFCSRPSCYCHCFKRIIILIIIAV